MTSMNFRFRSVVALIARFAPAILAMIALSVVQPTRVIADDDNTGWTKSVQRFTLDQNFINGCNGESVHIIGDGLISVDSRLHDGSMQLKEFDKFTGDGIGASGSEYKFDEMGHINQSNGPNPDGTPFSYLERRSAHHVLHSSGH